MQRSHLLRRRPVRLFGGLRTLTRQWSWAVLPQVLTAVGFVALASVGLLQNRATVTLSLATSFACVGGLAAFGLFRQKSAAYYARHFGILLSALGVAAFFPLLSDRLSPEFQIDEFTVQTVDQVVSQPDAKTAPSSLSARPGQPATPLGEGAIPDKLRTEHSTPVADLPADASTRLNWINRFKDANAYIASLKTASINRTITKRIELVFSGSSSSSRFVVDKIHLQKRNIRPFIRYVFPGQDNNINYETAGKLMLHAVLRPEQNLYPIYNRLNDQSFIYFGNDINDITVTLTSDAGYVYGVRLLLDGHVFGSPKDLRRYRTPEKSVLLPRLVDLPEFSQGAKQLWLVTNNTGAVHHMTWMVDGRRVIVVLNASANLGDESLENLKKELEYRRSGFGNTVGFEVYRDPTLLLDESFLISDTGQMLVEKRESDPELVRLAQEEGVQDDELLKRFVFKDVDLVKDEGEIDRKKEIVFESLRQSRRLLPPETGTVSRGSTGYVVQIVRLALASGKRSLSVEDFMTGSSYSEDNVRTELIGLQNEGVLVPTKGSTRAARSGEFAIRSESEWLMWKVRKARDSGGRIPRTALFNPIYDSEVVSRELEELEDRGIISRKGEFIFEYFELK